VSDRLTVNLGLRWESTGPWSEKDGHWPATTRRSRAQVRDPGRPRLRDSGDTTFEGKRDWKEFGPRVGATYRMTERAVLRGAYGIFYQPIGSDYWAGVPYAFAPGYRVTTG